MEYALRDEIERYYIGQFNVLILVVMEYALRVVNIT